MTKKEIIQGLQFTIDMFLFNPSTGETIPEPRNDMDKITIDSCKGAIELLKQEPILDKIRAEILEEKECAYADFERYKVEYLGQDWEDVLDSLPHDDFRYGMERAIELIDKYKAESEVE